MPATAVTDNLVRSRDVARCAGHDPTDPDQHYENLRALAQPTLTLSSNFVSDQYLSMASRT